MHNLQSSKWQLLQKDAGSSCRWALMIAAANNSIMSNMVFSDEGTGKHYHEVDEFAIPTLIATTEQAVVKAPFVPIQTQCL